MYVESFTIFMLEKINNKVRPIWTWRVNVFARSNWRMRKTFIQHQCDSDGGIIDKKWSRRLRSAARESERERGGVVNWCLDYESLQEIYYLWTRYFEKRESTRAGRAEKNNLTNKIYVQRKLVRMILNLILRAGKNLLSTLTCIHLIALALNIQFPVILWLLSYFFFSQDHHHLLYMCIYLSDKSSCKWWVR